MKDALKSITIGFLLICIFVVLPVVIILILTSLFGVNLLLGFFIFAIVFIFILFCWLIGDIFRM